jgi:ribosomal protein S6
MVFYESFFLISNRMSKTRFQALTKDVSSAIIQHEGAVISVRDYGWRNTAYPIIKPRVGKFFLGRWFHVVWGAKTSAVREVQDVFLHNSNVLRFMTTKISSPSKFYKPRSTFYLTPEAYQQNTTHEARHGPVDFSI